MDELFNSLLFFFYVATIIKKRLSTDLSRITMIIYSSHSFSHMVYVDLKKLQLTQKKKNVGVFYASATFYDIIVRINEAKSAVQKNIWVKKKQ